MAKFDVQAALNAGHSLDEINGYIKQNNLTPINMPSPTPTTQPTSGEDFNTNVGQKILDFLGNVGKTAVAPFTNYAGQVGQDFNSLKQEAQKNPQQALQDFQKNYQSTGNPLLDLLSGKKTTQQAVKPTLAAASLAVPFGEGAAGAQAAGQIANPVLRALAGLATKAVIPGAEVGALQGASDQNATPASITGNAAVGATGAGILHGLLGIPGLLGGAGKTVEKVGSSLTQDVNKIHLAPSVYGASQEKAVQQTIDKIPGLTAAQKYENLQPTMQKLGDYIQKELDNNPKMISIDQVKSDFLGNLGDQLRTKNLNSSTAKNEISGYLEDLYKNAQPGKAAENTAPKVGASNDPSRLIVDSKGVASPEYAVGNGKEPIGQTASTNSLPKDISTSDLFKLKQQINQDYQSVAKKLQNGTPLNDREKVIAAGRQTLDDIISNAHPNVKKATVMQSHLYDAAAPLASARNADHSFPVLGTKIPGSVIQGAKTIAGKTVQTAGQTLQGGNAVGGVASNPVIQRILGLGGALAPVLIGKGSNDNSNGNQGNPENPTGQQSPSQTNQGVQNLQKDSNNLHVDSISQNPTYSKVPTADQYAALNNGIDPSKAITRQQLIASQYLPTEIASRIKAAYDAQQGSQQNIQLGMAKHNADIALTSLEQAYKNGNLSSGRGIGEINDAVARITGKNPNLQTYNAAREAIAPILAKAFGDVGNVSQAKLEAAAKLLPTASSTREEAAKGFAQMRVFLGLQPGQ